MPRLIKKYANRRLYDTRQSRYITLEELKDLIVAGHSVKIIDAKAGTDISREVLMQLVAEQESLGQPILSEEVLTALIRFYGHPMQRLASQYLRIALEQLQSQSRELNEQMQKLMDAPAEFWSGVARQNVEWMRQLQEAFVGVMNPRKPEKPDSSEG